ncbi:chemotaxis protein CheB [Lichenicoccus sp.]|uniref:chemotaxis protein CheB n=1 Tax=Lichenicoccus sp. TaxID=2781899 RepID=UPI003D0DA77A
MPPTDPPAAASPGQTPARGPPGLRRTLSVIGIGASAGGLDACRKLVGSLGDGEGFACILVQHLDPAHESMMVELLVSHTAMTVRLAASGMLLEPRHLYVIPPGTFLSVAHGALRVSQPRAQHKARLPFDVLLLSLAREFGRRAACIVLSGAGSDGSVGLKAIREQGGRVLVQDPSQAEYDGMPRSAIATGLVDAVLPVEQIAAALAGPHATTSDSDLLPNPVEPRAEDRLGGIIATLRETTAHDFRLYKRGTLLRRIERRMAMAAIEPARFDDYQALLERSREERDLLARDLLINVTSFFRDREVFDVLAARVLPDMIRDHAPAQPLRLWVAGCSSGEEAYSLVMLFSEAMIAADLDLKIQVFASDVDAEAIATARDGLYPDTIEASVSDARLERFFVREPQGYRIKPEVRSGVVFTVQDLLSDPPFSRLDFISCRNLLIYLLPEAQAKVLRLFHFALRTGGLLLLGSSETAGLVSGRFQVVSQAERIYRHIGRSPPGEVASSLRASEITRAPALSRPTPALSQQATFAELCRQQVTEHYAPAAVLINGRNECLHFQGPTDHYLQVAPGRPTHDLLTLARPSMRGRLRTAIHQAADRNAAGRNANVIVRGGQITRDGRNFAFSIAVRPVEQDGERLLLVCFVNDPVSGRELEHPDLSTVAPRIAELELELEATRNELQAALQRLETSNDEQKAINDEALSFNEEYQSTNEELVTSKEELQALNEELVALNGQLQDSLEKQRTTSNDLKNILYSTDMATLFLDTDLKIRFFTPATRALFNLIPGDVGRPLADLTSLSEDADLLADARTMLGEPVTVEREIEARSGAWYLRRILPYYTHDNSVEGVVVTFADISERKRVKRALEVAKQHAEQANAAKSRFLAAVSHDLRQPLQTLTLIQGLLVKRVAGDAAQKLVAMLDPTIGAMSGMLNTLLDINQIDAGTLRTAIADFPVADLLGQLGEEFRYHADAQGLALRVVPCSLDIRSDRRLLEQMIRNLMNNAIKYTRRGRILVGCRRHGATLSIEVHDTGIGIAAGELDAIFTEYHQVDNPARERSRGLGLGLSIVRRLGDLLGHKVRVSSKPGSGSRFALEVALAADAPRPPADPAPPRTPGAAPQASAAPQPGSILIVEDDPELRQLLEVLLVEQKHRAIGAPDGLVALDLVKAGTMTPDLILADYNLPNGMDGLQVTAQLRDRLHRRIPAVILTGDISPGTLKEIERAGCLQLGKPIKAHELTKAIASLLPPNGARHGSSPRARDPEAVAGPDLQAEPATVFVIDDDRNVRDAITRVLVDGGHLVAAFPTCEAFLADFRPGSGACLLVDAYLPGMQGLELLHRLAENGQLMPAIMITGSSDVPMAVQAMKAGATDFIEKPIGDAELLSSVARAVEHSRDAGKLPGWQRDASAHLASLTQREREVMDLVLAGHPSKNIAADLRISQRTVENHRASIMKKTSSRSLPGLARLVLTAGYRADGAGQGDPATAFNPARQLTGRP